MHYGMHYGMHYAMHYVLQDLYVGNEKAATVKRRIVCKNCKKKMQTPRCRHLCIANADIDADPALQACSSAPCAPSRQAGRPAVQAGRQMGRQAGRLAGWQAGRREQKHPVPATEQAPATPATLVSTTMPPPPPESAAPYFYYSYQILAILYYTCYTLRTGSAALYCYYTY